MWLPDHSSLISRVPNTSVPIKQPKITGVSQSQCQILPKVKSVKHMGQVREYKVTYQKLNTVRGDRWQREGSVWAGRTSQKSHRLTDLWMTQGKPILHSWLQFLRLLNGGGERKFDRAIWCFKEGSWYQPGAKTYILTLHWVINLGKSNENLLHSTGDSTQCSAVT